MIVLDLQVTGERYRDIDRTNEFIDREVSEATLCKREIGVLWSSKKNARSPRVLRISLKW